MDRIELISSLAKNSNILCDIGCDHGYAIIKALKNYNVNFGIASDINDGPLLNCKQNIINNGLENKIDIVKSDGFKNINKEFDTAIISGMGGILIKNILEESLDKIKNKKLIIEANSDTELVRRYLTNNGFIITDEYDLIDQNKYYEIVVFEKGNHNYTGFELKYGPILLQKRDEIFMAHYNDLLNKICNILPNVKNDNKRENELLMIKNDCTQILYGDKVEMHSILGTDNYYREYFIDDNKRDLIIIAPGGGYIYTSPRESEPVAKFYNQNGYNVVIVNYRETNDYFPAPANYLAEVIRIYRNDKRVNKIIGLGFSAGGHNLLEVALHKDIYNTNVDLLMLGYPVVTSDERYSHKGSFKNLLGTIDDPKLLKRVSEELEVKEDAPELFIWGTYTDESVPVMNSLLLIEAYNKHKINCEYHMYPIGGHGLSLSNDETALGDSKKCIKYIQSWANESIKWLNFKLKND